MKVLTNFVLARYFLVRYGYFPVFIKKVFLKYLVSGEIMQNVKVKTYFTLILVFPWNPFFTNIDERNILFYKKHADMVILFLEMLTDCANCWLIVQIEKCLNVNFVCFHSLKRLIFLRYFYGMQFSWAGQNMIYHWHQQDQLLCEIKQVLTMVQLYSINSELRFCLFKSCMQHVRDLW